LEICTADSYRLAKGAPLGSTDLNRISNGRGLSYLGEQLSTGSQALSGRKWW